jgi:hypothetical protein
MYCLRFRKAQDQADQDRARGYLAHLVSNNFFLFCVLCPATMKVACRMGWLDWVSLMVLGGDAAVSEVSAPPAGGPSLNFLQIC